MLFEVDITEAGARFSEMIAAIEAGHGILIKRGKTIVCRLVPESAFAEKDAAGEDAALTPEQRQAKEVLTLFESTINDEF